MTPRNPKQLAIVLFTCLLVASNQLRVCEGAVLVVPNHEAVLVSEDTSPFTGQGVKSGIGGNAYFTSTKYRDPCDDYEGVKYPYTTLPEYGSKLLGFYVVTDCQVILCTKSRSRNTASACSYDGCVSQSSSSTGGSTKIYDLVPKQGEHAEFYGAQTGDICKCMNYDVGQRFSQFNGHETCYVSKTVVSLFGGYYTNCLRDDLDGLGKPVKGAGCANGLSSGSAAAAVIVPLVVVAAILGCLGYRYWQAKNREGNTTTEDSNGNNKLDSGEVKKTNEDDSKQSDTAVDHTNHEDDLEAPYEIAGDANGKQQADKSGVNSKASPNDKDAAGPEPSFCGVVDDTC